VNLKLERTERAMKLISELPAMKNKKIIPTAEQGHKILIATKDGEEHLAAIAGAFPEELKGRLSKAGWKPCDVHATGYSIVFREYELGSNAIIRGYEKTTKKGKFVYILTRLPRGEEIKVSNERVWPVWSNKRF
jgi:hypothetical protein